MTTVIITELPRITQREREILTWNALNIPRDTPNRLAIIASLLNAAKQ